MNSPAPAQELQQEQRLAEMVVSRGLSRPADVARARRLQQTEGGRLAAMLVRLGIVGERDMADVIAQAGGYPLLAAADYPPQPVDGIELSPRFLEAVCAVPVALREGRLRVALADPGDHYVISALQLAAGLPVDPVVGVPAEIRAAIARLTAAAREQAGQETDAVMADIDLAADEVSDEDVAHLRDIASEAPVIRLVNQLFQRAVESRASDIHIEPFEDRLRIRYRVDGVMREIDSPPARLTPAVISRVKIMAKLNIAERRLPQDGRIKVQVQGRELDLRVSTVPTLHGESVVMRLLDKGSVVLDFPALGFEPAIMARIQALLDQPHGIILVTGPTGSGKTTTLYTALHRINTAERKIITVEDPVEYQLDGINQIQTKSQIGLTFASALRAIVRQDPDVIMIGEMRDLETARIAVQSALTGHLVLSTLHTNDAAGSINRLLDMGVEDYLLTSTVNGILAQRLVRRLCPHCREPWQPDPDYLRETGLTRVTGRNRGLTLYRPVGCEACQGVGYQGRTTVAELLRMTDRLRRLVMQHAVSADLQQAAVEEGMVTMYDDGLHKCLAGDTTLDEVLRVTQEA
ncbi:type II secretion system protein GspE [Ectothiorhodospira shaposhnikovii]|uniref:type II secretion system ATPase GspE n=1 Tax=Ectothiorhodospira shaposhnikovii TaxID=1054 RepID=UPI001907D162|nr:type II secretion system ATPase GspE [Ectothiorhodospira shaposhnikovii]MBK1672625.1 type II secretion system protein GspE [Ectothiorhodospira shaposhnikovii]